MPGNTSLDSEESMPAIPGAFDALTKPARRAHTPEQPTPARKKATTGITQAQKQALIDNLQLEITEQARKMRAQYAEQSQALQSQLERRINRIPMAIRKRKLGDLLDERNAYERAEKQREDTKDASASAAEEEKLERKSLKRTSDQISSTEEDKENESPQPPSPSPKKRAKTSNSTITKTTADEPTTMPPPALPTNPLGSYNSNTNTSKIPRSPPKPVNAPALTQLTRPVSPNKPLPLPPTKPGVLNRTASRLALPTKKSQAQLQAEYGAPKGRPSDASNISAGTTVMKKGNASTTSLATTTSGTKGKTGVGVSVGFGVGKRITTAAASVKTAMTGVGRKTAANASANASAASTVKKENVASTGRPVGRNLRKRT